MQVLLDDMPDLVLPQLFRDHSNEERLDPLIIAEVQAGERIEDPNPNVGDIFGFDDDFFDDAQDFEEDPPPVVERQIVPVQVAQEPIVPDEADDDNLFGGLFNEAFEGEPNAQSIRDSFAELPYAPNDSQQVECPICMTMTDELYTLNCKDVYCCNCPRLLIIDLMDNGKVLDNEFLCPVCETAISDADVQAIAGDQHFQRLTELRERAKVDRLVHSGKATYCPIPSCNGYIHIINGKVASACALCRATVCPQCRKCAHPTVTCEEYKALIGDSELEMEELMMSKSWKRCPFCSTIVEKLDGCQFVKCLSKICSSDDHAICYLCGKGLNEKHHFSHFQLNGPFGNTCNTLDGIEDTPLNGEEADAQPAQEVAEEEEEINDIFGDDDW